VLRQNVAVDNEIPEEKVNEEICKFMKNCELAVDLKINKKSKLTNSKTAGEAKVLSQLSKVSELPLSN